MKIGDKIRFVDDVGEGIVEGFSADKMNIIVETEYGIRMTVPKNKCVVSHTTDDYGNIKAKQSKKTNSNTPSMIKSTSQYVEVDLHIEKLLRGKDNSIIPLEYQINVAKSILSEYRYKKGSKIVLIHGQGEGILRHALIEEIEECYPEYSWEDASFAKYGVGGAIVAKNGR